MSKVSICKLPVPDCRSLGIIPGFNLRVNCAGIVKLKGLKIENKKLLLFQALSALLNFKPLLFVIDLAALASRREYLKLDKWLNDKLREHQVSEK